MVQYQSTQQQHHHHRRCHHSFYFHRSVTKIGKTSRTNCMGVLQKGNSHQNWEDLLEKIDSNDRNRRNVKTITAASVAIHLSWNSRDTEGHRTHFHKYKWKYKWQKGWKGKVATLNSRGIRGTPNSAPLRLGQAIPILDTYFATQLSPFQK